MATGRRGLDPYRDELEALLDRDPFGFGAGDPNLYRYVHNGPTDATDPNGLEGEQPAAQYKQNQWLDKSLEALRNARKADLVKACREVERDLVTGKTPQLSSAILTALVQPGGLQTANLLLQDAATARYLSNRVGSPPEAYSSGSLLFALSAREFELNLAKLQARMRLPQAEVLSPGAPGSTQRAAEARARQEAEALDMLWRAAETTNLSAGTPLGALVLNKQLKEPGTWKMLLDVGFGAIIIASGVYTLNPLEVFLGVDQVQASVRTYATGRQVDTITHKALFDAARDLGASERAAGQWADGLQFALLIATGAGLGRFSGAKAAIKAGSEPGTWLVNGKTYNSLQDAADAAGIRLPPDFVCFVAGTPVLIPESPDPGEPSSEAVASPLGYSTFALIVTLLVSGLAGYQYCAFNIKPEDEPDTTEESNCPGRQHGQGE
jgi:hypothetical protein